MVLDRVRGGDPHAIWGFGREVYFGPWAQGVPKRATLIGVYNDEADFIAMTDDIESFLNTEPIHAVA